MPKSIKKQTGVNEHFKTRIKSISEVQFMLNIDDTLLAKTLPSVGFAYSVSPDMEAKTISLLFGVQYSIEDIPILECRYEFVFEVPYIEYVVDMDNGQAVGINGLMPDFISVAIGTMRGIIVVKTAGTPLSKYPLPMLDPVRVLESINHKNGEI